MENRIDVLEQQVSFLTCDICNNKGYVLEFRKTDEEIAKMKIKLDKLKKRLEKLLKVCPVSKEQVENLKYKDIIQVREEIVGRMWGVVPIGEYELTSSRGVRGGSLLYLRDINSKGRFRYTVHFGHLKGNHHKLSAIIKKS